MNANGAPLLELKGVSKSFGAGAGARATSTSRCSPARSSPSWATTAPASPRSSRHRRASTRSTTGEFLFEGQQVKITSPTDAVALGIATVYQDLALCDNLDVVENLFLGREEVGGPAASHRSTRSAMEHQSHELLESLAVTITERARRGRARCPAASASRWRSRARCSASRRS